MDICDTEVVSFQFTRSQPAVPALRAKQTWHVFATAMTIMSNLLTLVGVFH
jgi:hypothetical protein